MKYGVPPGCASVDASWLMSIVRMRRWFQQQVAKPIECEANDVTVWSSVTLTGYGVGVVRSRQSDSDSTRVGIAGEVGMGVEPPPVHVYTYAHFLNENRFKMSIPVQNFKHFDI